MNITDFLTVYNYNKIGEILPMVENLLKDDPKNTILLNFIKRNLNEKLKDILVRDILKTIKQYEAIKPLKPVSIIEPQTSIVANEYLTNDVTIIYHDNKLGIEKWPITFNIRAKKSNGMVNIESDKDLRKWIPKNSTSDKPSYACIWALFDYNGKRYAGCCDGIKQPTLSKATRDISGRKIEREPVLGWMPKSGEKVGIFITGLARGGKTNVKERSNVVWVTW